MANLSRFRVNSKAQEEGEWVRVGDEYDDLEIRTRGFTSKYLDARAAKMRAAARHFGGDVSRVPNATQNEITVDCLIQHALLDVRNLADSDGQPITFDKFTELLRDPDYADLVMACVRAAAIVGLPRGEELEEAKKNSPTS